MQKMLKNVQANVNELSFSFRRNLQILEKLVYQAAFFDIVFALVIYVGTAEAYTHEMEMIMPVLHIVKILMALVGCLACFVYADVTHKVLYMRTVRIRFHTQ